MKVQWDDPWVLFGFSGQLVFGSRFFVQWLASEKAKKSIVPVSFWYLSILGSGILLAYALHNNDPVIAFGQASGFLIYIRNLVLVARERARADAAAP